MNARSFVLGAGRAVSVKLGRLSKKAAYLSSDGGKAFKLCGGDVLEIRRSQSVTRLVRLTGRSFYEVMSQKLGRM